MQLKLIEDHTYIVEEFLSLIFGKRNKVDSPHDNYRVCGDNRS